MAQVPHDHRLSQGHEPTPIDFDALPAVDVDVPAIYRNKQFSQEFQLVADKGPLQGVAGFYYLDANAFDVFDVRLYTTGALLGLPGFTAATRGDVDTKTWAVFADLTYDFTPQWSVSLGGRYTNDKRHAKVFRAEPLSRRLARAWRLDPPSTRPEFPVSDRPPTSELRRAAAPTRRSRRAHRSASSRRPTTTSI